MKPSFAIVGCGKVGNSLGRNLLESGYPLVGLASQSLASAQATAEKLGIANYSQSAWEVTSEADIVFITTPDGLIQEAFGTIDAQHGFKTSAVVLHCSGALPSTILAPAVNSRVAIGSMHPLQSFASRDISGNPFKGIVMSVEGEPRALDHARRIADDLGAHCLTIRTAAKTLYHAAAVAASNYLVTLMNHSFELLKVAGISAEEAFSVLGPLVQGTLKNIQNNGIERALTGPIARGDVATIQKHLKEIVKEAPAQLRLYQALGLDTVKIARAGQSISDEIQNALQEVLERTKS